MCLHVFMQQGAWAVILYHLATPSLHVLRYMFFVTSGAMNHRNKQYIFLWVSLTDREGAVMDKGVH